MTNPLAAPMPAPLPELLPYHRMARVSVRHRWWRPVLGTGFVAVAATIVAGMLYGVGDALGAAKGYPEAPDGTVELGPVTGTALDLLAIASAIPVVLLAVRWIGRRPAGTVSSVTGGLRWRWLGLCVLAALPVLAVTTGVMLLLPTDGGPPSRWAGWEVFGPALAMLVVLVPLQAAAEEYVFRGWLTQAVGGFLRSPWFALVPQAVLFAAAHGWGTPWGFADLAVYAVVAGWLTVRTGGLEAAIGLHAVNNLLAFGISAAVVDGLKSDDTATDAPWQYVVLDLAGIALYTAAVLWLARRRPPTRAVPAPAPVPPPLPFPAAYPQGPGAYPWAPAAHVPFPGVPVPYTERTDAPDLPLGATPSAPPPGDDGRTPR
ncbi:CPBP family intramembrane glutamic endopeptidase [Streptomyces sp. NBC_00576]|uniref:CPBP family intramembrane glutamic endopeptidase n=1 Tax=Streptomyces sp. NBC_00576 TaxID=2903665 RepID=UPI002E7FFD47|nr:type II CAAX endopeptidase family protein [Streptomyces sp. NBC_00576]WUB73088.1 CPBP family intramembrane metalloprotease [Streptomyces sp. NBC_00576]